MTKFNKSRRVNVFKLCLVARFAEGRGRRIAVRRVASVVLRLVDLFLQFDVARHSSIAAISGSIGSPDVASGAGLATTVMPWLMVASSPSLGLAAGGRIRADFGGV